MCLPKSFGLERKGTMKRMRNNIWGKGEARERQEEGGEDEKEKFRKRHQGRNGDEREVQGKVEPRLVCLMT